MRRTLLLVVLLLASTLVVVVKTTGQGKPNPRAALSTEKWEYLVVSGPGSTNFEPTGNPDMRKHYGYFRFSPRLPTNKRIRKLYWDGAITHTTNGMPSRKISQVT